MGKFIKNSFTTVLAFCFYDSSYSIWKSNTDILSEDRGQAILAALFRATIASTGIIVMKQAMTILYTYYNRSDSFLLKFILRCGKETLALYILQGYLIESILFSLVMFISNYFGFNPFIANVSFMGYIIAPAITLATMYILMCFIDWCKNHKYTDKLFGFKMKI
jgi:hypothetical protein